MNHSTNKSLKAGKNLNFLFDEAKHDILRLHEVYLIWENFLLLFLTYMNTANRITRLVAEEAILPVYDR